MAKTRYADLIVGMRIKGYAELTVENEIRLKAHIKTAYGFNCGNVKF